MHERNLFALYNILLQYSYRKFNANYNVTSCIFIYITRGELAKNNDRSASAVALVHAHAHNTGRSCDSFNRLAKEGI